MRCVYMCTWAQSCLTLYNLMDCSPPGPLSIEFSRQEYWSWWPFPTPGNLPDPGIEPKPFVLADGLFTIGTTWEAILMI